MSNNLQDNKRIVKNTLYLYIREIVTLFISFYSVRLLLKELGQDDYGLYGLIGSVLGIFSAMRAIFSSAIQRFINIEKSSNNTANISEIFSIGIITQVALSIIFAIVVEIAGYLIIPNLSIPPESIGNAFWVLHFTIAATVVTLMTVPYDAIIIANEKFNILAAFSTLENILRLCIIYLLTYIPYPKVITYSVLLLLVSILIRSCNSVYCKYKFRAESTFSLPKSKDKFKQMTVFAGWQFFGNFGYSLITSGINFIINIFGGVAVNAARGIAYQVMNAVTKFTSSINASFQPQTMVSYARKDENRFFALLINNAKYTFIVSTILCFTLATMIPSLMGIWLEEIPPYTIGITQAIFLYPIVRSFHAPIDLLFKATGNLKAYQICELIFLGMNLPISWLLLHLGAPFYSVFITMSVIEIINLFAVLKIANKVLGFNAKKFMIMLFPRALIVFLILITLFFCSTTTLNCEQSLFKTLLHTLFCFVTSSFVTILIIFNKKEISKITKLLTRRIKS